MRATYDYLQPDITAESKYTGTAPEADVKYRKPALGTSSKPPFTDEMISVLDSILEQDNRRETGRTVYTPFLTVPFSPRTVVRKNYGRKIYA
jgi:hypothetical protein